MRKRKLIRRKNVAESHHKAGTKQYVNGKVDLTKQQERFCYEYVNHKFNGYQAAVAAGYCAKHADARASQLLTVVKVKKRISEVLRRELNKVKISTQDIVDELKDIAFSDMGNFVDWDSKLKTVSIKSKEELGRLTKVIKTLQVDKYGRFKVELYDKVKTLELLGKNLKMFTDKIELDTSIKCIIVGGDEEEIPEQVTNEEINQESIKSKIEELEEDNGSEVAEESV